MVIILVLYLSLVWLLFFKFKWLPWNKASQWLVILIGTVILTGFLVGLQALTPSSTQAIITARMVDVAPQVSGRVERVEVKAFQPLEQGAVLFRIEPTLYQARLKDLEARLALARIREEQSAELVAADAGSVYELQSYEAQVEQLEAQVDSARFDLDNTVVRAPSQGVVPFMALGQGVQVSPSRSVLTFIADDEFVIGARFAQKALQTVKVGDTAMVNFPALPGQVFESKVVGIPGAVAEGQFLASGTLPSIQQDRMFRVWPVLIQVPDDFPSELRKPGVAAQVYIHTEGAGVVGIVAVILQWVSTSLDLVM
jgi:multidrug resistance efflux pump